MTVLDRSCVPTSPISPIPGPLRENLTPNWFASVMGTGIVATSAATLPVHVPGIHAFAVVVWVVASSLLVFLGATLVRHWAGHRDHALRHARDPVTVQFVGAIPMALLTVGSGAALVGGDLVGHRASVAILMVCWVVGTLGGLGTALAVPLMMITRRDHADVRAVPAWLMPVVPPMVSASTGALVLPHTSAGAVRTTAMMFCYGLFGLSLVVGLLVMSAVLSRLLHGGLPPVQAVPTVWIMLGLVGQSITAANLLGSAAGSVVADATLVSGLRVLGLVVGLVMGGFGAWILALAVALTIHAARRGLSFSLSWWSFTFPVGTCVTGASALSHALASASFGAGVSGAGVVGAVAAALYVLLLGAWAVVAVRTAVAVRMLATRRLALAW